MKRCSFTLRGSFAQTLSNNLSYSHSFSVSISSGNRGGAAQRLAWYLALVMTGPDGKFQLQAAVTQSLVHEFRIGFLY